MSAADLRSDERKATDAAIRKARVAERERCAGIARLAADHAGSADARHAAEAIAATIENDVI